MIMFFIACLAETNRAPFDLPEAEAELVAGYFTEYSSSGFSLFFLAEYGAMILMSALISVFFMGGWLPPLNIYLFQYVPGPLWLALKTLFWLFLFVLVRASLPRYRYDRLMILGWKVLLPLSLAWFLFTAVTMYSFELFQNSSNFQQPGVQVCAKVLAFGTIRKLQAFLKTDFSFKTVKAQLFKT
eukprot:TRINITY_DN1559_c2_g1_i2.p2 TRINITY_DN1559_c2_g1~~TRINITY_DN1559_c2_g1_i2.p2  ORF type:complete len:185 (-),score=1.10 TRINITY_DN1559_c2_g1_i2:1413-1967(-)